MNKGKWVCLLLGGVMAICFATERALSTGGRYLKSVAAQNVVGTINANVEGAATRGYWIGCTFRKGTSEKDLTPYLIDRDGQFMWVNLGRFDKYSVTIWSRRLTLNECKRLNKKACQWCKKNGYHLEGMIETTDWQNGTSAWGY